MTDYLPEGRQQFERRFPAVEGVLDSLGPAKRETGPLILHALVRAEENR